MSITSESLVTSFKDSGMGAKPLKLEPLISMGDGGTLSNEEEVAIFLRVRTIMGNEKEETKRRKPHKMKSKSRREEVT